MPPRPTALDEVYQEILAWDLYQMLEGHSVYSVAKVPVRFNNIDEFLDTFEPLLLEECRAQTLRSMNEGETIEHQLTLSAIEMREPYRIVTFDVTAEMGPRRFFDTDLVFASYEQLDVAVGEDGEQGQEFHALGIVTHSTPTTVNLKFYLPPEPTARLPPAQQRRLGQLRKVLVPSSGQWWLRKLGNMVTMNREFQALYSVRDLPLCATLMSPLEAAEQQLPPQMFQPSPILLSAVEARFNPSQLASIRMALRGHGITLIQGPPGTGKTKTILGILSLILATAFEDSAENMPRPSASVTPDDTTARSWLCKASPWLRSAPYAAENVASLSLAQKAKPFDKANVTDRLIQLGRAPRVAPPRHVLICAPSNSAIDEIVSRLLQVDQGGGLLNAEGKPFMPLVVRVGPNVKESLHAVSLDYLSKKRQTEGGDNLSYETARMAVLNDASIVCTTLSCAGYAMFSQLKQGFDTVLIDEAAQAVEVSTLIPLKYGCRRLILVGDPNQLPATVFSSTAQEHNYEQSLFQRLQLAGLPVRMLTTQYRMHPHISLFPGASFYNGELEDAPHLLTAEPRPWHSYRLLAPYMVFDVADGQAEEVNSSWSNDLEAQLALIIVRHLLATYSDHLTAKDIGIIAPYNGQVRHIRGLLKAAFGAETASELDVNSVDGFQGREKSVILLSCVRSDHKRAHPRGIGFVKDARRINVSMTRAKHSLFILGNKATLQENDMWASLFEDAQSRDCLIRAQTPVDPWFKARSKEVATSSTTGPVATPAVAAAAANVAPATSPSKGAPAKGRGRGRGRSK